MPSLAGGHYDRNQILSRGKLRRNLLNEEVVGFRFEPTVDEGHDNVEHFFFVGVTEPPIGMCLAAPNEMPCGRSLASVHDTVVGH